MNEDECFPLDPLAGQDLDEDMSLVDFDRLIGHGSYGVAGSSTTNVVLSYYILK